MTVDQVTYLIVKQLTEELTSAESQALQIWMEDAPANHLLVEDFQDPEILARLLHATHEKNATDNIIRLQERVKSSIHPQAGSRIVHRVHFLKTAWFRFAAAIIILFGTGAYLYLSNKKPAPVLSTEIVAKINNKDIAPGSNKATLTLADGSTIILDSAGTGQLAIQQGTVIKKSSNGEIIYNKSGVAGELVYNTMSTPRGGQYQVVLPDNTKVWLNAASSITYPTAFINNERIVSVEGEVYFEVAKNEKQPFIVKTQKETITVLGTEFNVNAYVENEETKTSLIAGAVRVKNVVLKPGQAYNNGRIISTDIEQDIAWKNGYFSLYKPLKEVMKELARWYDVTIVYEGQVPDERLFGKMGRDLQLSQVLNGLKELGVNCRLEKNRRLIIAP